MSQRGMGPTSFYPDVGPGAGGDRAPGPPPFSGWAQPQPPGPGPVARVGGPGEVPAPMPPPGGATKKALIVGINYRGTSCALNGCINDAKCMEYMLRTKFGFRPENVLIMTDDMPDPMRLPTRYNMFLGFQWLLTGMKPGDSLVFHYSGHGSQQPDYSGEEPDGKNETLCPLDFKRAGEIVDDELNRQLINPIPEAGGGQGAGRARVQAVCVPVAGTVCGRPRRRATADPGGGPPSRPRLVPRVQPRNILICCHGPAPCSPNPLMQGVKLHAVIDACHSGSVMDLPYSAHPINGMPQWRSEYSWQPRSHKVDPRAPLRRRACRHAPATASALARPARPQGAVCWQRRWSRGWGSDRSGPTPPNPFSAPARRWDALP